MPRNAAKVRVLVADDHPLYREALARAIATTAELELVGQATTGPEALSAVERLRPDVAVLDVKMPGDGRTVLAALERGDINTRIVFLSEYSDPNMVREAVTAGAAGFLAKDSSTDVIRRSIIDVANGGTAFSARAREALAECDKPRYGVSLTTRELEVLRLTSSGLSNHEIAGRLYISPETVKTHLRQLYRKLDVPDRTAAVAEGLRRGLIE